RDGFRLIVRLDLDFCSDCRNRPPIELDNDRRGDLELDELVLDRLHDAVEAARGDHLVAHVDPVLHCGMRRAAPPGRHDQQQPAGGEQDDDDQEVAHYVSNRSRSSRLYAANPPRSIAARAPAARSQVKRRLCRESSRSPKSSFWFTRWRM